MAMPVLLRHSKRDLEKNLPMLHEFGQVLAVENEIVKLCIFPRKFNRNVVCSSSFTGASNPGNDGSSVFSVAYSKCLVRKI